MKRSKQQEHPNRDVGLGYIRVSTREQGDSGLGLAAQRDEIERACELRHLRLYDIFADVASGKRLAGRDKLAKALTVLESQQAAMLIVKKMDRLGRSLPDVLRMFDLAKSQGWDIKILDLDLDTSTPQGRFVMQMFAALGELEGAMISQRTKEAMDLIPRDGPHLNNAGVLKQRPHRPSKVAPEVVKMMVMLKRNRTYEEVATALTDMGIKTPTGKQSWSRSTIQWIVEREREQQAASEETAATLAS